MNQSLMRRINMNQTQNLQPQSLYFDFCVLLFDLVSDSSQ